MWAGAATGTEDETGIPLFAELSEEDVRLAIEAAEAVGDDRIQQKTQGQVTEESWTHGSAAQRAEWFRVGFDQASMAACDTFATDAL
jgi:predicted metalloprotease